MVANIQGSQPIGSAKAATHGDPAHVELQVRWMQREIIKLLTEASTLYDDLGPDETADLRQYLDSATDHCLQACDQLGIFAAELTALASRE